MSMLLTGSNAAHAILDPEANPLTARVIASICDIALVIDGNGVIVEINASAEFEALPAFRELVGQRWIDHLTKDSHAKAEHLLTEARRGQTSRSREMNMRIAGLGEVPFRFTGTLVDGERVLAFGLDIRSVAAVQQRLVNAQLAMEAEFQRVRQSEAQYRVLFHVCSEGVVLAQGPRHLITDINPAALKLLGKSHESVHGKSVRDLVAPSSHEELAGLIASVEAGKNVTVEVRTAGEPGVDVTAQLTVFRQAGHAVFLFRFWPERMEAAAAVDDAGRERTLRVVQAMPDGFVVTDHELRILTTNASFCELVELASETQVVGTALGSWLGRAGVDLNVIVSKLRSDGVVRNFSTVIRGDLGGERGATVTAVATPEGDSRYFGFTIRPTVDTVGARRGSFQSRSPEQLKALVGQTSLKEIVQESADMIERLCIEAALEVSGNNRAVAAHLLGLSRQSLYTKMRRYGLEEFPLKASTHEWDP